MFFDASIFYFSSAHFVDLFPYLLLSFCFALAVLGAGFRAGQTFLKTLGFFAFIGNLAYWAYILSEPTRMVAGLAFGPVTRVVGVLVSGFAFLSFAAFDVPKRYEKRPEWLALSILCVLGLSLLPASRDWISFFVFLESFSIPAYVLVALDIERERSLEASVKYLLTGAFSSALLLMGIALVYFQMGTLSFDELALRSHTTTASIAGLIMILSGFLFKLTAAPFHFWAADVYQGAPAGFAAFLAAATKVSVFATGALVFEASAFSKNPDLMRVGVLVGILSALIGSFLAFHQRSFRRMLAYSGTVNAGILVPLMLAGNQGIASGMFFLFTYGGTLILVLSAFSGILRSRGLDSNEDLAIDSFCSKDKGRLAFGSFVIVLCLISFAGIPPMPGFLGKYWAFADLWKEGHVILVLVALFSTLLGVAYYIRIAGKFFFNDGALNGK